MRANCIYCGEELKVDGKGILRRVTCWAENGPTGRPLRLISPVDLQQYAHKHCHEFGGTKPQSLF